MTASDFTHPSGDFTDEMFPGETLTTNITTWITAAEAKTDDVDGQKAWVNYLGWKALYARLVTAPASVGVEGEGSQQYLISQMNLASNEAQRYLEEYRAITNESETTREWAIVRSRR